MVMTDNEVREWLHSMDIYDYDLCDGVVHVVGDVDLYKKRLASIPVQFGYVSGNFICRVNNLISLEGGPIEVGGDLNCEHNNLVSLEGCPSEVGGNFNCINNNLTSLEGCPTEVGGGFYCRHNLFKDKPDTSGIKIGGEFRWE
jgi:hypothetical protein